MGKFALLIGVSESRAVDLPGLPSALKDIQAMQEVLQNPDLGGFDSVERLPNPTRQEMEEAIETLFTDRKKNDLLLFFFSGHGITDERGKLYLVTPETRKERGNLRRTTAVSANLLHENMGSSISKHQVLILDCCFSGAIAEGLTGKSVDNIDIQRELGGEGRAILTSSNSVQKSFHIQGYELSIYTHFLIDGIKKGAANLGGDDSISVDELHEYIKKRLEQEVPSMNPQFFPVREGYKIKLIRSSSIKSKRVKEPIFVGREQDFTEIEALVNQGEHTILILSDGGVGKTTLAQQYFRIQKFDLLLECHLDINPARVPLLEYWLERWLLQLNPKLEGDLQRQGLLMLQQLKQNLGETKLRIGVIVDNLDTILENGKFTQKHDFYRDLLVTLADQSVQSTTTLITSREPLNESGIRFQPYRLKGLKERAWKHFFELNGIQKSSLKNIHEMHRICGGNAEVMHIIKSIAKADYGGDVNVFWKNNKKDFLIESAANDLIEKQFDKIQQRKPAAYKLLCRMGFDFPNRPPLTENLISQLLWDVPKTEHITATRFLRNRSLIKTIISNQDEQYYLDPMIQTESMRRLKPREIQEIRQRIGTTKEFIIFPEEGSNSIFRFNLDNPLFNQLGLIVLPLSIQISNVIKFYEFLLDTGSSQTVLSSTVSTEMGLNIDIGNPVKTSRLGGESTKKGYRGIVDNIQIGEISLGSSEIIVMSNFPMMFSRHYADGILGSNVLQNVCLKIDYPKKILEMSV
mgnify:CR=1 FL=1